MKFLINYLRGVLQAMLALGWVNLLLVWLGTGMFVRKLVREYAGECICELDLDHLLWIRCSVSAGLRDGNMGALAILICV